MKILVLTSEAGDWIRVIGTDDAGRQSVLEDGHSLSSRGLVNIVRFFGGEMERKEVSEDELL